MDRRTIQRLKRRIRQELRRIRSPEDFEERYIFRSVERAFGAMLELCAIATAHHWSKYQWRRILSRFRDRLYSKFSDSHLEYHREKAQLSVRAGIEDWDNTFKDYYNYSGESIEEIACRWAEEKEQLKDTRGAHGWFSLWDVWPLREYTWTRDTSRPGPLEFRGEDLSGEEKWDALKESMKREGWDEDRPAIIYVGKNGYMKVGEGNHRLAVAKELGMKEVPVRFYFKESYPVEGGVELC